MHQTAAESTCFSDECPKKEDTATVIGINLMEIAGQKKEETYIEVALREWLLPAPDQGGKQFSMPPPPNVNATLGLQTLNITSDQFFQLYVFNGVCTYSQGKFCNEMPFALPIPLV